MDKLVVSSAPFKQQIISATAPNLFWIVSLLPALVLGLVFKPAYSLLTVTCAVVTYIALEAIYIVATNQLFFINILKSLPTAMILGMLMPTNVSVWVPIGCAGAVFLFKVCFGDDNGMIVNKVAIGIVTVLAIVGNKVFDVGFTTLTPDAMLREGQLPQLSIWNYLVGNGVAGAIGTTCVLFVIIGGVFLCVLKLVNFKVPVIGTIAFCIVVAIVKGFNYIIPELCSGSVLFVLFFVSTEYFTCPNRGNSGYIYGALLGVVMATFKLFVPALGEYSVLYALLVCNLFVAFMDKWQPKYFGEGRNAKVSV